MDASNKRDFRHFVLLQHGVLGTPADVDALICHLFHENERRGRGCRAELSSNTTKVLALPLDVTRTTNKHGGCIFTKGNLVCFAPGSNKFLGTNRSTCSCAKRVLREFLPVFSEWLDAARRADDSLLCFSCVGHSFGGLIMREMLYLLLTATELEGWESGLFAAVLRVREELAELNVTLENFVTIATPHCGVSECLLTPVYCGAWVLAKTCAPSMQELLLMDNAAVLSRRLVSSGHLATLRLFRRRTLFANTQNDLVVGFATSSLLFDDAQGDKVCVFGATPRALPCTAAAFSDDRSAWSTVVHLPRLHDSETAAALSHTIRDLRQGGWGEEQAQKKELASPTHLSPHAIAAALRQELDWRVVALRYTSVWPVAHLECLGMLRQYSAAPEMVQRVAQEVLELH